MGCGCCGTPAQIPPARRGSDLSCQESPLWALQVFIIESGSSQLLRACLGARPDTCSILTGKVGKEEDSERKDTGGERGRGPGICLDEWVEHILADQENEDLTGPLSTLPVSSWALFPHICRRTIEVSGAGKEVSEAGAIGVSPDVRVPIWNLFRQCHVAQGVQSLLPVALRPLGKVWDLAIR